MFSSPAEHLAAELQRLTLLLHREILRLRAAYQLSLDEFRGLYVSDEQVDRLVESALRPTPAQPSSTKERPESPPASTDAGASYLRELKCQADAMQIDNEARVGRELPWARVATEWGLSAFEKDVLLLALAPEVDLKYETIYAYLNNDVTRKWPTFDLALRLFAPDGSNDPSLRRHLLPDAPLFRDGLLQPVRGSAERPSWLAGGFCAAPAACQFILGLTPHDPATTSFVEPRPATAWEHVPISGKLRARLESLAAVLRSPHQAGTPLIVLEGRPGTGRLAAAEALCADHAVPLLAVDLESLRADIARSPAEGSSRLTSALALRRRLTGAALYLRGAECLFDKDGSFPGEARRFFRSLLQANGSVFLAGDPAFAWRDLVSGHPHLAFSFPDPDYPARRDLWQSRLAELGTDATAPAVEAVASRFILTPGQIRSAVAAVAVSARFTNGASGAQDTNGHKPARNHSDPLPAAALIDAARGQSEHNLGSLATRVPTTHGWDDLVLPPVTLRRVRDVAAAVRNRHIVYEEWGFSRRVSAGQGLKVLFAGPSGTGKTMTAGVIAADLGLDLYRIELSGVVSKYIGETEKNLERIFRAARHSNAMLFFDEADAMFGKRSEVKDAHDRYANVETAYLLQRIEEHEGVVILASNLSKNIDEAFRRRLHYIVDFPLPDESHREKLWRGMFPPQVPLAADIDFSFLAKQFPLPGGDIRNVALDAAFLSVANGRVVTMQQLIRATSRQLMKQGTVPSAAMFKQYRDLIA